jgi:hypothetical protein
MNSGNDIGLGFFLGFFAGMGVFVALSMIFYEYTALYKRGQVDALSGKVVFELKQQDDGSVLWERKEKK